MNHESSYAETYRRNQTTKNVILGVLVIAVIALLVIVLAGGCEYNPSTTPSVDTTYEQLIAEQVKNDLLQAELDKAKAELDALKCGANDVETLKAQVEKLTSTANSWKEKYQQANSTAKAWKDKYESHKCSTSSTGSTSVDLSGYVAKATYDAKVKEFATLQGKYNTLENAHKKCSTTVDLSKYVAKATYDVAVEARKTWETKYNELLKLYNELIANGGNTNVNADHSGCVAKSEYDKLNNRLSDTQIELASFKAQHANCNTMGNHNNCVAKSTYDAVVKAKSDLEVKYNALVSEYNNYKANHSNCGSGTTTVYADHSNCVSLTDYKELLAKYNALLGY